MKVSDLKSFKNIATDQEARLHIETYIPFLAIA